MTATATASPTTQKKTSRARKKTTPKKERKRHNPFSFLEHIILPQLVRPIMVQAAKRSPRSQAHFYELFRDEAATATGHLCYASDATIAEWMKTLEISGVRQYSLAVPAAEGGSAPPPPTQPGGVAFDNE